MRMMMENQRAWGRRSGAMRWRPGENRRERGEGREEREMTREERKRNPAKRVWVQARQDRCWSPASLQPAPEPKLKRPGPDSEDHVISTARPFPGPGLGTRSQTAFLLPAAPVSPIKQPTSSTSNRISRRRFFGGRRSLSTPLYCSPSIGPVMLSRAVVRPAVAAAAGRYVLQLPSFPTLAERRPLESHTNPSRLVQPGCPQCRYLGQLRHAS
jgi:hypothetical protein